MKLLKAILALAAAGIILMAMSAPAQTGTITNRPNLPPRWTNPPPQWWTNIAHWTNQAPPRWWTNRHRILPPRVQPQRGDLPPLPADVQTMVQQFQTDREAFIARERQLAAQLQDATEQQRQQVLAQMRELLEQWKQQQAEYRQQLRDQADRMRDQLRDHSRVLDRGTGGRPGTGSGGPRGR